MPRYAYAGPDPRPDDDGGYVRPGEIREMDAPPDWGPWAELDEPQDPPADPPASDPPPLPRRRTAPTAPADTPTTGEGENQ